ncbi:hypothetical protein GCM10012285_24200 [Streptomyces kronopolitis]|uniref:Uncharacterized protein n=1 Tax=Streptomyces kronopolitis TaxID=1612435 RepID=A0ABQ2JDK8_9ACTN|nr:hypothetical protein [Streptomyces kronopolitis]GGN43145.1 hypothetical protein GCM10012285_24200 [Streptomyces kronopolitis]
MEGLIALGLLLNLGCDHKYPKIHPDQVANLSARADLLEILARERPLGPDQAADARPSSTPTRATTTTACACETVPMTEI